MSYFRRLLLDLWAGIRGVLVFSEPGCHNGPPSMIVSELDVVEFLEARQNMTNKVKQKLQVVQYLMKRCVNLTWASIQSGRSHSIKDDPYLLTAFGFCSQ